MTTLKEQYEIRKLLASPRVRSADARARGLLATESSSRISQQILVETSQRVEKILTEEFDQQEAKQLADTIGKFEKLIEEFGGTEGQLPSLTKMMSDIVAELQKFGNKGWMGKLVSKMGDRRNPLAKAAALEGLLKSGFAAVESIMKQGGSQLDPEKPLSEQPIGQTLVKTLSRAFDPGRSSPLTGRLAQLFNTSGALGPTIAKDLSSLKPRQLVAFAQKFKTVPVSDQAVKDAENAASQGQGQMPQKPASNDQQNTQQPGNQGSAEQNKQSSAAPAKEDLKLASPDEPSNDSGSSNGSETPPNNDHMDPKFLQNKVGLELGNISRALKSNNQGSALYYAAMALQKLGLSPKQAIEDFNPKSSQKAVA